jgi:formate C-acetyltransferase
MEMSKRSSLLQQTIKGMLDAGVRRTTFYPLISESLEQTRGRPRQLRRALAFAHLLDHVEQVVLPHELLTGSITGMWPLAVEQATLEQHLREARTVIGEYMKRRERTPPSRPVERWALMARDHYEARIRFADLQHVAQELAKELENGHRLPYAELYRVLENHFVFDYGKSSPSCPGLPQIISP